MKNLQDVINESIITEAAAKNIHNPRKGSTVYLLKKGESKAIPVKISNTYKIKDKWYGSSGGYDIEIEFENNAYGVEAYRENHYGGDFDYSDEKHQVREISWYVKGEGNSYYVGVSKEAIQNYINTKASKKVEGLLKQIEKLQKELNDLEEQKQAAEADANLEITESLQN